MRRILTLTALLFFMGMTAKAQLFSFGPKIGVSNTTLNIKDNVDQYKSGEARYSYHAGVFGRVKIAGFYIQPEAYFNAVRGEYLDPNNPRSEPVEFNQNKIDMPVLFGWKFGPARINAGPVASFNLSDLSSIDDPNVEDYKTAVFAFQAGIGVDISKFLIDLRYEGNLSNQATLGEEGEVRVNQIMLSIGYNLL